ncbi:MAG TPA: adenosine kinase [Acidimicrobiales bacterium]|nr:adenosine kinase [Acidimicrobiales bacterium]
MPQVPAPVVTVGHAIVDVLAPSPDDLVNRFGLQKGTMTLIDDAQAATIYAELGPATEVSGGSAANTAAVVASLGAPVQFLGKIRNDVLGDVFAHDIRASGVTFEVPPATEGPGTGRCLIMVTPDAEKTMCTSLGIGAFLMPEDLDFEAISSAKVAYIEGYLYGLRETDAAVEKTIELAKTSGTKVALSLADPVWVELNREHFDRILDSVDLLFANELEACEMAGLDPGSVHDAVAVLSKRCHTVAVTLGASGSMVATGDELVTVPAAPVERVVDTTGAGDSYAGGFLFGFLDGAGPRRCAELGALAASEIVSHLGARPQQPLVDLARRSGLL